MLNCGAGVRKKRRVLYRSYFFGSRSPFHRMTWQMRSSISRWDVELRTKRTDTFRYCSFTNLSQASLSACLICLPVPGTPLRHFGVSNTAASIIRPPSDHTFSSGFNSGELAGCGTLMMPTSSQYCSKAVDLKAPSPSQTMRQGRGPALRRSAGVTTRLKNARQTSVVNVRSVHEKGRRIKSMQFLGPFEFRNI